MKNFCKLFVCCVAMWLSFANNIKADSPLTSTEFHVVYEGLPVFKDSVSMCKYLLIDSVSVEKRLAVINRLGWNVDGKNDSKVMWRVLTEKYQLKKMTAIMDKLSGFQLICVAYLKAMDNYSNVKDAMFMAAVAEAKEPQSYAVNLIAALIRAQYAMDYNWGAIFLGMDNVRANPNLKKDFSSEASSVIFKYTDLYKKYVE